MAYSYDIDSNGTYFYAGEDYIKSIAIKESVKHVIIEKGITYIADKAFANMPNLETITWNTSVRSIGNEAFKNSGIKEVIIPDSVTSIGEQAFSFCPNLVTVKIGNNIKDIPTYAFSACHDLHNLTLGNKVETIGYRAFSCIGLSASDGSKQKGALQKVVIPPSVRRIDQQAFGNNIISEVIILSSNITLQGTPPNFGRYNSSYDTRVFCQNGKGMKVKAANLNCFDVTNFNKDTKIEGMSAAEYNSYSQLFTNKKVFTNIPIFVD